MHTPVLLKEAVDALKVGEGKNYIDATYGEGGHSLEIVKHGGKVLAIEWDESNFKNQKLKIKNNQIELVWGNYRDIEKIARKNKFYPVDGILFDLGISMVQIGASARGFSYKARNEPLDMRISRTTKKTAADIVNSYTAGELYEIFARYSEEIDSGTIAEAIVGARRLSRIDSVGRLVSAIVKIPGLRSDRGKVVARIFQALRMAVNDELANLEAGLGGAYALTGTGGRIVVITFHPGEDRIVKRFVRTKGLLMKKGQLKQSREQIRQFERSAHIRVIEVVSQRGENEK